MAQQVREGQAEITHGVVRGQGVGGQGRELEQRREERVMRS